MKPIFVLFGVHFFENHKTPSVVKIFENISTKMVQIWCGDLLLKTYISKSENRKL